MSCCWNELGLAEQIITIMLELPYALLSNWSRSEVTARLRHPILDGVLGPIFVATNIWGLTIAQNTNRSQDVDFIKHRFEPSWDFGRINVIGTHLRLSFSWHVVDKVWPQGRKDNISSDHIS